jgi:quercetin dioxygenase-like cupin family protein
MPFRLVRLSTGDDGQSHVTEGEIELAAVDDRNAASPFEAVGRVRFEETRAGSALDWHPAPERQYVVTLSGTLEFETRDGQRFVLGPGDVLLADDTAGGGHRWRLVDDQPWRRVYITF